MRSEMSAEKEDEVLTKGKRIQKTGKNNIGRLRDIHIARLNCLLQMNWNIPNEEKEKIQMLLASGLLEKIWLGFL